jgi:hypothetical protein
MEKFPLAVDVPIPVVPERVRGFELPPFSEDVQSIEVTWPPAPVSSALTVPLTGPVLNQPFDPFGIPLFGDVRGDRDDRAGARRDRRRNDPWSSVPATKPTVATNVPRVGARGACLEPGRLSSLRPAARGVRPRPTHRFPGCISGPATSFDGNAMRRTVAGETREW